MSIDLNEIEEKSIYLLRESYHYFKDEMAMLWSIGKDSTVLLHLAKKSFLGKVPFPLIHIDTSYKIPEMIKFRDQCVIEQKLDMIIGRNEEQINNGKTYPNGQLTRLQCCQALKTDALVATASASKRRLRMNHQVKSYELDKKNEKFSALIMGIRSDEEGSRSKERYFSVRRSDNSWPIEEMPPELWDEFSTFKNENVNYRIHPLLDWTEKNIWQYIARENIKVSSLYFDQGTGERYRSLGCAPCTKKIKSSAITPEDIIVELSSGELSKTSERAGRDQDKENNNGLEALRRKGYM